MKKMKKYLPFLGLVLFTTGCASNNQSLYQPQAEEKITVAKAQNEIKVGMSSAKVIEVLGSPNIISTDKDSNEVWVYDKISTQSAVQSSGASTGFIPSLIISGGSSGNSSATSQRTLTIIVKFDNKKMVKNISYHTSRF